jgi:carbamoylphosphate synthase large subunit
LLNNKALFRVTAEKLGIPVPCTYDANHSLPEHTLIVKPVDSFSGKGITIVSTLARDALGKAISKAKSMSKRHDVVIEDFIDGQLYSHSAFINDGKIINDYWVIEHSSVNRFVVDTSHVAFDLSIEIKRSIQKDIERLVRHLDLKNGLLHTQFMVDKHRYFFIEVTRRCPGDLYSKLIQKSTGHNYALAYVAGFVGKPVTVHGGQVELEKKSEEYILRHTITQDATLTFRELAFSEKVNIAGLTMIASVGDILEPSPSGRVGIVFFRVSGREELTHLKQRILTRSLYHIH